MVALTIGAVGCGTSPNPDGGRDVPGDVTGNITAVSVTLAPAAIMVGENAMATATGMVGTMSRPLAANEVTWSSSDTAIATVNAMGQVAGVARGQAQIIARVTANPSITAMAQITVNGGTGVESIQITPATATVNINQTQAYTAIIRRMNGTSEDGTSLVQWNSSNTAIATIMSGGTARGVAPGTSMITATFMGVTSNNATLTVADRTLVSISLTPVTGMIRAGSTETVAITATATYNDSTTRNITQEATWSSSAATVATVSNTMGMRGTVSAAGNMTGTANITATLMGVTSSPAVITVIENSNVRSCAITPMPATVAAGGNLSLIATATFEDMRSGDITTRATWSSAAAGTATVGANTGVARGVAAGTTMITASIMNPGTTTPVTCTVNLTVTDSPLAMIQVSPSTHTMSIGSMQTFTATGVYMDGSTRPLTSGVSWTTTNSATATISTTGVAVGVAAGTTTVRAEVGAIRGEATLVISMATPSRLTLMPADPRVPVRGTQQLRAIATLTDGSTEDVTSAVMSWVSSMPSVAAVDSAGLVTGVAAGGPVTITATYRGIMGSTTVIVSGAFVRSIAVTATATTTPLGVNQTFTAIGTFSDDSVRDLTNDANLTWSSSMPGIATISNATGERGLARPVAVGTTNITATFVQMGGNVTSTPVLFTVADARLDRIELEPAAGVTVDPSFTTQVRAFGVFSDGVRREITENGDISWSTGNNLIATVSITPGTRGVVTGVATGTTDVRAAIGSVSASAPVTVTGRTLVSMAIAPSTSTIRIGTPGVTYTVTGTFSSGPAQDITDQVTFTSNDPARIGFDRNRAFAVAGATPGPIPPAAPITITATRGSITATATAVVAPVATVRSITVSVVDAAGTATSTVPVGFTAQATACAIFDDGVNPPSSCQPFTDQVVFTTSDSTRATVDNAAATRGRITGIAATTSATDVRIIATYTPSTGTPVSGQSPAIRITDCAFASVRIRNALTGSLSGSTISLGDDVNFRLEGVYATSGTATCPTASAPVGVSFYDLSRQPDVMWTSSNTAVAQITSTTDGATVLVPTTATSGQTADLNARWRTLVAAVHPITTTGLCVQTYSFDSASSGITLPGGSNPVVRRLIVRGTMSDGTTVSNDLVNDGRPVNFTSTGGLNINSSDGTINSTGGSTPGMYTVTATLSSAVACPGTPAATTTINIVDRAITQIRIVDPITPFNVGRGESGIQLRALATYEGVTGEQDVTNLVDWDSTNTAVTIADGTGSMSVSPTAPEGTAVITATYGGQTGRTTATIITRTLQRVTVRPNPTVAACDFDASTSSYTAPANILVPLIVEAFYSDAPTTAVPVTSVTYRTAGGATTVNAAGVATTAGTGNTQVFATFAGMESMAPLTITTLATTLNAVNVSLVAPGTTTIPLGGRAQFRATGDFTGTVGGSSVTRSCDVTPSVAWTVTATMPNRFVFDPANPGVGTATTAPGNTGPFTVNATRDSVLGAFNMVVSGSCPVRIRFQPATAITTARGTLVTRQIWADYSDGTEAQLTGGSISLASSNTATATANFSGGVANIDARTGTAGTTTTITATYTPGVTSCSGSPTETLTSTIDVTVTAATVTSVTLDCTSIPMPAIPSLRNWGVGADPSAPVNTSQDCRAFAVLSDNPVPQNVTAMATWSSSRPSNASVNSSGTVRALAPTTAADPAVISATFGGQTGTFNFNVNAASVVDVSVVDISGSGGTSPVGFSSQYEARARLRIGTTSTIHTYIVSNESTWVSRAPSIATVDGDGTVTGVAVGSAQIDATFGTGTGPAQTGSTTHIVNDRTLSQVFVLDQVNAISGAHVSRGLPYTFRALGYYCRPAMPSDCIGLPITEQSSWRTANPAIATVSDSAGTKGTARAVAEGTTNILATFQGITGTYTGFTVDSNCINGFVISARSSQGDITGRDIPVGARITWDVRATFSDGATPQPVTLSSSTNYNRTSGTGTVGLPLVGSGDPDEPANTHANTAGPLTITVTTSAGQCAGTTPSASISFNVVDSVPTSIVLGNRSAFLGEDVSFTYAAAYDTLGTFDLTGWNGFSGSAQRLVFASSDTTVAQFDTISAGGAVFNTTGEGTATITATYSSGTSSTAGAATLTVGGPVPATIFAEGLLMSLTSPGNACRSPSSASSWTSSVPPAETWTAPANSVARVRGTRRLTDGTDGQEITECGGYSIGSGTTSVGASIECIAGRGVFVHTGSAGSVVVRITDPVNAGVTPTSITLTVLDSTPTSVVIDAADPTITPQGVPVDLTLIGTYDIAGGTPRAFCISDSATWTTSSASIASVTTGIGGGDVTTNAVGIATITASIPGAGAGSTVRDDVRIDVRAIDFQRVFVSPANLTMMRGATAQLRAFAHFSDGVDREVTSTANFVDSTPGAGSVLIVDPVRNPGLVRGASAGSDTIGVCFTAPVGGTPTTLCSNGTAGRENASITVSP